MMTTTGPVLILPRFGTPRNPLRPTYGPEVAEVAERLGTPLMPWQRHAVDVALEYDPATGELVYSEVVLTVPRQAGKTTLTLAVLVWRCLFMARRCGPQNVTYLAQKGVAARKKLEREFAVKLRLAKGSFTEVRNAKARPSKAREWKLGMNNGSEHIVFGTSSYLQIAPPTETASHGETLDLAIIDEAFAHPDDRVEQAVEPAMITRTSAQLWVISTAGNAKSPYLYRKVLAGRQACESGRHGSVCYLEWSAPDHLDFDAPGAFESYHPACGWTIPEGRLRQKLEKARRSPELSEEDGDDPGEDGFRRAYGNQWVSVPLLGEAVRPSVIPDDQWRARMDPSSQIVGGLALGVDVGPDGSSAAIGVVGRRDDGLIHVEVIEAQPGTWWLERRLGELVAAHGPVVIGYDSGGPAAALAPEIQRAAGETLVKKIAGREYSAACEAFVAAVQEDRIRHLGQTWLATSIGGAARRVRGDGWMWDRKEARADITPLVAVTVALRALEMAPMAEVSRPVFWA